MIIQKLNEKTKQFEDYKVSDEWHLPLYSDDMNEVINCVNCGKKIKFGDGYTSLRYRTIHGFGYCECYDCYEYYYTHKK